MGSPTTDATVIRRYRPTDHDAVYDICVRTADAGGDARGQYATDDLMPDLYLTALDVPADDPPAVPGVPGHEFTPAAVGRARRAGRSAA